MKIEIIFKDAKCRIVKMIDEHCWEVIRDLLDDCMEGKDDYTARKSCAKRIGMKALKASKKTIQKGVIKLATGGLL